VALKAALRNAGPEALRTAVPSDHRTVPLAEPAVPADDVSWTPEPQVVQDPHVNRGRILHYQSGQRL